MQLGDHRFTISVEPATIEELKILTPKGHLTDLVRNTIRLLTRTLRNDETFIFALAGAVSDETRRLSIGPIRQDDRRAARPVASDKKRPPRKKTYHSTEEGPKDH